MDSNILGLSKDESFHLNLEDDEPVVEITAGHVNVRALTPET